MAAVLKTAVGKPTVGSNPTPSAILPPLWWQKLWRWIRTSVRFVASRGERRKTQKSALSSMRDSLHFGSPANRCRAHLASCSGQTPEGHGPPCPFGCPSPPVGKRELAPTTIRSANTMSPKVYHRTEPPETHRKKQVPRLALFGPVDSDPPRNVRVTRYKSVGPVGFEPTTKGL